MQRHICRRVSEALRAKPLMPEAQTSAPKSVLKTNRHIHPVLYPRGRPPRSRIVNRANQSRRAGRADSRIGVMPEDAAGRLLADHLPHRVRRQRDGLGQIRVQELPRRSAACGNFVNGNLSRRKQRPDQIRELSESRSAAPIS